MLVHECRGCPCFSDTERQRSSRQFLLAVPAEHALIESAASSNRIEGVTVEPGRVRELIFGHPLLRDRDEEELRGYCDALTLIHENTVGLPVNDATIQKLHRLTRGEIWDADNYKDKDGDIIERFADGRERVFRTVIQGCAVRGCLVLLTAFLAASA